MILNRRAPTKRIRIRDKFPTSDPPRSYLRNPFLEEFDKPAPPSVRRASSVMVYGACTAGGRAVDRATCGLLCYRRVFVYILTTVGYGAKQTAVVGPNQLEQNVCRRWIGAPRLWRRLLLLTPYLRAPKHGSAMR